jgi:uncharacterized protein YabE (DUF348 family)
MQKKLRRLHRTFESNRRQHVKRMKVASRHPFAVPVFALFGLLVVSLIIFWTFSSHGGQVKPAETDLVIVSYDHHTVTVPSHEPTVKALLAKLKITINPGDVVEPALSTAIKQDDFRINVYRAVPVKVIEGETVISSYNAATTPRTIAAQSGLNLYPEDGIKEKPVTNFLKQQTFGSIVTVTPSVPVNLTLNGLPVSTRTLAGTVGEFLKKKGITMGKDVTVTPAPNTPITPDINIAVTRDGTGIQTVTQDIAMPTQYINDASLAYGTSAIRQAGSPGKEVLTYKIVVQHGQVVSRTLLQTVVIIQPVTQIAVVGTSLSGIKGDMALAGIAPGDYNYADYIISHESGWCPTKAQGQYGSCPAYTGYVPPYGGYGLCQATPGSKMSSAGSDWATNPVTQLRWCAGYAQSRYGGWYNAYIQWVNHHYW